MYRYLYNAYRYIFYKTDIKCKWIKEIEINIKSKKGKIYFNFIFNHILIQFYLFLYYLLLVVLFSYYLFIIISLVFII